MDFSIDRALTKLEEKYLRDLKRAPKRGELMNESIAQLKVGYNISSDNTGTFAV